MAIQPEYVTILADDGADSNAVGVSGSAPTTHGIVRVGGFDGSADRELLTDTTGKPKVLLYDANGNAALVAKGTAPASNQGVIPNGIFDGTNMQAAHGDSSGRTDVRTFDGSGNALSSSGGSLNVNVTAGGGSTTNITATNTTGSIAGAGGTGNVNLTTSSIDQIMLLLEVRPSTTPNDFEIKIFSDSGRTKMIYWVDQITLDEWVADEYQALPLPDGIAYVTIVNNAAGAKTFTVSATVEVRS